MCKNITYMYIANIHSENICSVSFISIIEEKYFGKSCFLPLYLVYGVKNMKQLMSYDQSKTKLRSITLVEKKVSINHFCSYLYVTI